MLLVTDRIKLMNNFISKFKSPKRLFFTTLIIGLVFLVLYLIFWNEYGGVDDSDGINLPPVVSVEPELKFVKAYPDEGLRKSYGTYETTAFEFDQPLNKDSFIVFSTPPIRLSTRVFEDDDYKILWVSPDTVPWEENKEYTITIKPGGRSVDGAVLKQEINYKLSIEILTEPVMGGD